MKINTKNLFYPIIILIIICFVLIGMAIFSLSGITKKVSNTFYNYTVQDLPQGEVAGEYVVRIATGTIFDKQKQAYLKTTVDDDHCGQNIWALLETNRNPEKVHDIIQEWVHSKKPDNYCWSWQGGIVVTTNLLWRILNQYGDKISSSDKNFISLQFSSLFSKEKSFFHKGTLNNRLLSFAARYLYSEQHPQLDAVYGKTGDSNLGWLDTFTYQGRRYVPGNTYSSLDISKDWLSWKFDQIVGQGNEELDSQYTGAIVVPFYLLYDFATDTEMRKKAKMIYDFILLDSIMDVSANMHGGTFGRTYGHNVLNGQPQVKWWTYWGIGPDPGMSMRQGQHDSFVSSYRLPSVIEDMGILDDEPDNYWHLNLENNYADRIDINTGKWTYLTKYYNLGGSQKWWALNILSNSQPDSGLRLWIDDQEKIPSYFIQTETDEYYLKLGKNGYQFRNAMFIKSGNPHLHVAGVDARGNKPRADQCIEEKDGKCVLWDWSMPSLNSLFDDVEDVSGWKFLREGEVMVAIKLQSGASALEVAIIGVDYPSYKDFKDAVIRNARVSGSGFTTSKGVTIRDGEWCGLEKPGDLKFPFDRIETYYGKGQALLGKSVDWQDNVMTIDYHGMKCVYDFKNWDFNCQGAPLVNCSGVCKPNMCSNYENCTASSGSCSADWHCCEGACGVDIVDSGGGYNGDDGDDDGNGDVEPQPYLTSDFNQDFKIDIIDFGILLSHWNRELNKGNIHIPIVGHTHLAQLLSCWGNPSQDSKPSCWSEGSASGGDSGGGSDTGSNNQTGGGSQQTTGTGIEINPDNPHYFLYNGQPTVLISSGAYETNLTNSYFKTLAEHGINRQRHVTMPNVGRDYNKEIQYKNSKVGDGWNETYWNNLKKSVEAALNNNVVFNLVFLSTCMIEGNERGETGYSRWDTHLFSSCNGGPVYVPPEKCGNGEDYGKDNFYTLWSYGQEIEGPYDESWPWQKKNQYRQEELLKKYLTEIDYPNVIYTLMWEINDIGGTTKQKTIKWLDHFAAIIKKYQPQRLIAPGIQAGKNTAWLERPNIDWAMFEAVDADSVEGLRRISDQMMRFNKPLCLEGYNVNEDSQQEMRERMRQALILGLNPSLSFRGFYGDFNDSEAYDYALTLQNFIKTVDNWCDEPGQEITENTVPRNIGDTGVDLPAGTSCNDSY